MTPKLGGTLVLYDVRIVNMLNSSFYLCLLFFAASIRGLSIIANKSSPGLTASYNASNSILSETLTSPFPYEFPELQTSQNLFPMPPCNGVILEEATIDELQRAMAIGQLTSTKISMCYLQRIYQTDDYIK